MCFKTPKLSNISSNDVAAPAPDLTELPEAVQLGGTAKDTSEDKKTGRKSVTVSKAEPSTRSRQYV